MVSSSETPRHPSTPLQVLRRFPAFRTVWLTQSVSQLGDQMYVVTLSWLVAELTGSEAAMAAVRTASMLPVVLFGLLAGAYVDRSNRQRLLILCDAVRIVGAGAFAMMIYFRVVTLGAVVAFAVFFGLVRAFFDPAYMAYVPQLVDREDIVPANGLQYIAQRTSSVVGPGVGGFLVALFGYPLNVALNAASFAVGALGMTVSRTLARPASPARASLRDLFQDIKSGVTYLLGKRQLLATLVLSGASNLCFGPFIVLMPFFVKETLGSDATGYGLIESCFSLGLVIGAIATGYMAQSPKKYGLFVGGHIVEGLILAVAGFSARLPLAMILFFLFGLVVGPVNIIFSSLAQLETSDEYRGRVGGVIQVWNPLNLVIGYAITGRVARYASPGVIISLGGLLLALFSAAIAWQTMSRARNRHASPVTPGPGR